MSWEKEMEEAEAFHKFMQESKALAVEVDWEKWALENQASFGDIGLSDVDATISFLESVIEDQNFQIEALKLRIDELTKKQCGC